MVMGLEKGFLDCTKRPSIVRNELGEIFGESSMDDVVALLVAAQVEERFLLLLLAAGDGEYPPMVVSLSSSAELKDVGRYVLLGGIGVFPNNAVVVLGPTSSLSSKNNRVLGVLGGLPPAASALVIIIIVVVVG